MSDAPTTILIANPSADVYGSDLQMLESVSAMIGAGWRVVVTMPADGELVPMLKERGAEVQFADFPVLRRANSSVKEFIQMVHDAVKSLGTIRRIIQTIRPSAIYVNTVTLPWWLLVARMTGTCCVCHVHEAETTDRRLIRIALNAPLIFANALIVISNSALEAMLEAAPFVRSRAHLIYNGVSEPPVSPQPALINPDEPIRLAVVGRLSPRKAPDLALDAVALLRSRGRNVNLAVCGTAFTGYEWYVEQLYDRADQPDLSGAVTWLGYVSPIWPVLADAHIVLAPSLREPFGNAVVEAQLAARPVIATAALGHLETVIDGSTGLLVPAGNIPAIARAVERLVDDPDLACKLANTGRQQAIERFSISRYQNEIVQLLMQLTGSIRKPD